MRYRVNHITRYSYAAEFASCHNQVHLIPRESEHQHCLNSEIRVDPEPEVFDRHDDSFGNPVESFSIHTPSDKLTIESTFEVELFDRKGATPLLMAQSWEQVQTLLAGDAPPLEAVAFLFESAYVSLTPAMLEFARPSFPPGRGVQDCARDLVTRIFKEFKFDPNATDVGTSVSEVLKKRRGVCQDFAHLMIGCLRSMGLSARYVSGYLLTNPAPGKPRLVGADASHAWCSVWCPDLGWVDYDPTNNLSPCDRHITVAFGRDYGDVSPVRGVVLGGGKHRVRVSVDVSRL